MKTVNVGGKGQVRKRLLLPLLALAAGLCVPIYAYAGSEQECNSCHSFCNGYAYYDWVAYAACHQACGSGPACN